MEWNDHIQQILDTLPGKPGCYLMKDEKDRIIYVGKAINLRNVVRSYFHSTPPWNQSQNAQISTQYCRYRMDMWWGQNWKL